MSQPKPPPVALRRALEAFVDAFRDEVPEDRRSILPRGPGHLRKGELLESQIDGVGTDIIPIYVSHEVRLALATEIFEMPAGQAYSLPEEVQGVLEGALGPIPGILDPAAQIDVNAAVATLVTALGAPTAQWSFRAPLFRTGFELAVTAELPGGGPLQLRTDVGADGVPWMFLEGAVRAHSEAGALLLVERVCLMTVGAGLAAGVFVHAPSAHPQPSRVVTIEGRGLHFDLGTEAVLARCWVDIPRDLSEIERRRLEQGHVNAAFARYLRILERALRSEGPRADELRNACRMACLAATSPDDGVGLTTSFAMMEGLLLDRAHGDQVVARLCEAVAHSIGRSYEERRQLRAELRRLYDLRSSFVHSVKRQRAAQARQQVVELMLHVLKREIEILR